MALKPRPRQALYEDVRRVWADLPADRRPKTFEEAEYAVMGREGPVKLVTDLLGRYCTAVIGGESFPDGVALVWLRSPGDHALISDRVVITHMEE